MQTLTGAKFFAPAKRKRKTKDWFERAKLVVAAARERAAETSQQRSAIGGDSDNLDGDAERLEKDARQAVEEFLGCQRESAGLLGWWRRRRKVAN